MAASLNKYRSPDTIFVDANIFLFHAFADPLHGNTARHFLKQIELGKINALTSVLVENEVIFKILLQEAGKYLPRPSLALTKQTLRTDVSFRDKVYRPAEQYLNYIHHLTGGGLRRVDVTVSQTQQGMRLAQRHGLLITDATHIATCQAYKVRNMATGDKDMRHIADITVWPP